jgi:hypothetical protein
MKNAAFKDITLYGPCRNRCTVFHLSVLQLLITANVVPSSLHFVNLIREAIHCSETSVLRRTTRRNIPGDGILQSIMKGWVRMLILLVALPVMGKMLGYFFRTRHIRCTILF